MLRYLFLACIVGFCGSTVLWAQTLKQPTQNLSQEKVTEIDMLSFTCDQVYPPVSWQRVSQQINFIIETYHREEENIAYAIQRQKNGLVQAATIYINDEPVWTYDIDTQKFSPVYDLSYKQ
ncbi:MAG: hypothetical protein R3A45_00395 [Bdellovibrionota bacterium]